MLGLSLKAKNIQPSATLAIEAKAKQMKQQGLEVISLSAGEPDFDSPLPIKEAGIKAIKDGFTKYTPASGILELKQAVVEKFKRDNALTYDTSQILISNGAKHSIYNALLAVCQEGDEVIIPTPFWVSYPELVKLTGAKPVLLETKEANHFKFTAEDLAKVVTPRTKLLILNSPSNPTGQTFSRQELIQIAAVAEQHDFYILSDEIYEALVYDGFQFVSIASLNERMPARTIVVNGVSKAYAMTGWRIGYAAGPKDVIAAMSNIQSQTTSNPASISQKAALAALSGDQGAVQVMKKEFEKRRTLMVDALNKISGVSCLMPTGAFYAFPNFSKTLERSIQGQKIQTTQELAAFLLEKANVALVPGDEFGAPGYLRLSYATSPVNIEKGLQRIKEVLV